MSNFYLNPNSNNEPIIRNIGKTIRALDPEKRWHVVVKLFKKNRSLEQQAYYWACLLPCVKNWLYETRGKAVSEEAIHESLKPDYCPYTQEEGIDGKVKVYKSTTKLSTIEFNEMTDKLIADFADQGLYIPPPDKNWKRK